MLQLHKLLKAGRLPNIRALFLVNFVKDLFSGITDIFGGRSSTYENELQEAREKAIDEMCKRAERLGANAVVGVDVDYEVLGKENGMLMVSISGTAVKLK